MNYFAIDKKNRSYTPPPVQKKSDNTKTVRFSVNIFNEMNMKQLHVFH